MKNRMLAAGCSLIFACFFTSNVRAQSWSPVNNHLIAKSSTGSVSQGPNLGLGTDNPLTKIDIRVNTDGGGAADTRYPIQMKNENNGPYSAVGLKLQGNDGSFGCLVYHNPSYVATPDLANTTQLFSFGNGLMLSSITNYGSIRFMTNIDNNSYQIERMRIDAQGNVGIGTKNPTTALHIKGGNSPVRIEGLAQGSGATVVITKDGYLRRSSFTPASHSELKALQGEVEDLKAEIQALKSLINQSTLQGEKGKVLGASLEQNIPNPAANHTQIPYFIPEQFRSAELVLYGPAGQVLGTHKIEQPGFGMYQLDTSSLPAGLYVYSLRVDQQEVRSKKMILSK